MPGRPIGKGLIWFAAALFASVIVLGVASPGCVSTDVTPPAPDGPPAPASRPVDQFRRPWDSEARTGWRVTDPAARISQIAYDPPAEADAQLRALGFAGVQAFVRGPMAAYVASAEGVTVVAFRGTDNDAGDWIANLNCTARPTPHGDMHAGFAAAYDTLRADVVAAVKRDSPEHLWITGHSLGGALAVVCAYDLVEREGMTPRGLLTFGQPMVASDALAGHLDRALLGRFAHVVNERDIVPRVPPCFVHCGSLVWFLDGQVRWSKPKRQMFNAVGDKAPNTEEKGEIEAVSEAEFERIKADIRRRQALPDRRPDEPPKYEGDLPFIRDHPIGLYLDKVRTHFGPAGPKP